MQILREVTPVARKLYRCDAYHWVDANGDFELFTEEERQYVKQHTGNIRVGQQYIKQICVDGYDFWVYRADPVLHKIALKYYLFPED